MAEIEIWCANQCGSGSSELVGFYCDECWNELKAENAKLREALQLARRHTDNTVNLARYAHPGQQTTLSDRLLKEMQDLRDMTIRVLT